MHATVHTLILASALAEGGGDLGSGLGINALAFASQLVSFGIVFFILWRWGFPAITKVLDKRTATIEEGIQNAERARRELADANARSEQILTDARREAQATIEKSKNVAQQEANRIREEAQADALRIREQNLASIQQEANKARAELNRLVVNLSIDAAERVVGRSVDNKDNRRLVEEFVASSNANSNQTRVG